MLNNIFSFHATERGYHHAVAIPEKVCEDASAHYDDSLMSICVVADGHGSDNYPRTDRGSKFAVQAALEQIKEFVTKAYDPFPEDDLKNKQESKELISQILSFDSGALEERCPLRELAGSILSKWHELVDDDFSKNPFKEDELVNVSEKYRKIYLSANDSKGDGIFADDKKISKAYGSTLIVYVVTEEFSFGLQLGDGKCIVINDVGEFTEPIPWNEDCQFNVTTSICDDDAISEFRYYVSADTPAAVFCGTDGIDDSYASEEEVYALYRSMLLIFAEHGNDVGEKEIQEYLPILTKRGSGDDVSIALILDSEKNQRLNDVFEDESHIFDLKRKIDANKEKEQALKNDLATARKKEAGELITNINNQINELRSKNSDFESDCDKLEKTIKLRRNDLRAKREKPLQVDDVEIHGAVETESKLDCVRQEEATNEALNTDATELKMS